jgi:hypothetical protein
MGRADLQWEEESVGDKGVAAAGAPYSGWVVLDDHTTGSPAEIGRVPAQAMGH